MLNKLVAGGLCLAILVGCDKVEQVETVAVNSTQTQQSQAEVSSTAIYLPGGAGIDFKKEPLIDKVVAGKSNKLRIVRYEIGESVEEVDKAVASILEPEGYVRKLHTPGKEMLKVSYSKVGTGPTLWRYHVIAREGFEKVTVLTVSWNI